MQQPNAALCIVVVLAINVNNNSSIQKIFEKEIEQPYWQLVYEYKSCTAEVFCMQKMDVNTSD